MQFYENVDTAKTKKNSKSVTYHKWSSLCKNLKISLYVTDIRNSFNPVAWIGISDYEMDVLGSGKRVERSWNVWIDFIYIVDQRRHIAGIYIAIPFCVV